MSLPPDFWGPDVEWMDAMFASLINPDKHDWKLAKRKGEIASVYQSICHETQCTIYRLEAVISNATVEACSHRLHPLGPYRLTWDSHLQRVDLIGEIDEVTMVLRHITAPQFFGLVAPRDSITLTHFSTDETGARQVVIADTEHLQLSPESGIVRAQVHPSGIRFAPGKSANTVNLTLLMHADIRMALLPEAIRDTVIPKQCIKFADDLQKSINNKKLKLLPAEQLPPWA